MSDLEARLVELGDQLDLEASSLADDVLARLDAQGSPSARAGRWRWLRLAAAAAVVVVVVAVAVAPGPRRTVARWLGLEQVRIEVRPDLEHAGPTPTVGLPGPGNSRTVEVAGSTILVSALDGRIDRGVITKTVASSSSITELTIEGKPGMWIEGDAHEVAYVTADGEAHVVRAAADTLLWQDGAVLYRLEGFDTVDDALAFAAAIEPP